ncbi:hypothetical protein AAH446_16220 [Erwinia sp. P6884]|uniref:hypothetical protein n=1 Tax=Erwinia sp. P6884 TaxID=3141450 RepID=UPI00318833B2
MKAREIRKLNRAKEHRVEVRKDVQLEKAVGIALSGCSINVLTAVTAAPNWRVKPEPEFVTKENPEYRKVNNPYGQLTNARQKMRGCSIPLI